MHSRYKKLGNAVIMLNSDWNLEHFYTTL